MELRKRTFPIFIALTALTVPAPASAVTGSLTPAFGTPLATQTSQSNVGGYDRPSATVNQDDSSQLDAIYGYVDSGVLHLFFTGNLTFWVQLEGGIVHWLPLDVFIDCAPGGQHQLLSSNPAPQPPYFDLNALAGLTFDTGFAADYWLCLGGSATPFGWPNVYAYYGALPTGGGGPGAFLGLTPCGPPGTLSGGVNPNGIQVTLDDSNPHGLGNGCGAAATPTVTTGIEWSIPLAAIGNPTGCIRVTAFVSSVDHTMISNQVTGPVPPGTCALTPAASVNFAAIAGDQFVDICPPTPAHGSTWGAVKSIYR
jgi:hypothetical protein